MLRVACVLRSGGDYDPQDVKNLREAVARHLTRTPYRFACLTDFEGVQADEVLPLQHDWPGWWSKIELFDGRLAGPVLYFDLDTEIVGSLDDIALGHNFTMLENFLYPSRAGSGVMAWRVDLRQVYRHFCTAPEKFMREYRAAGKWGDQAFIERHAGPISCWQFLHPGKVVSFKVHCRPAGGVPPRASVVCFHGFPRPWELDGTERAWFGK